MGILSLAIPGAAFLCFAMVLPKTFLILWALWIYSTYSVWSMHFKTRAHRHHPDSPSYLDKPDLTPMDDFLYRVNAMYRAGAKGLSGVSSTVDPSTHTPGVAPATDGHQDDGKPSSNSLAAQSLDMNHMHLTFWQYMWAGHFVAGPSLSLLIYGILKGWAMRLLKRTGMIPQATSEELRLAAGKLLLETSCVIQVTKVEPRGDDVFAEFVWPSIPLTVDLDSGTNNLLSTLTFEVELNTAKVIKAYITSVKNQKDVEPKDFIPILAHVISAYQHPKIHAYANWGIDPAGQGGKTCHPYVRQMAIVTTIYNHFGFNNSPGIFAMLHGAKAGECFLKTVERSLVIPTPAHPDVKKLAKYSKLVHFINSLRIPFLKAFEEHRDIFPSAVNGDAYFLGTVMHSLDHAMYSKYIDQIQFLFTDCSPQYRTMKVTQETVRLSLSDDLPFIYFARYYSEAPTHFHKKVYKMACDINKDLAGLMQTCIIK